MSKSESRLGIKWSVAICLMVVSVYGFSLMNVAYAQYGGIVIGGGGGGGDSSAPMISNINVSVSGTKATITWTTNESSISWVAYGISTSYGSESKTITYNTSHSIILNNLSTGTTYHYQVKSQDSAGNIGSYTDKTFTTSGVGAAPATPATPATPAVPGVTPAVPATPATPATPPVLKALPFVAAKTTTEMQTNLTVLMENLAALQTYQKAVASAAAPTTGSIPSAGSYKANISSNSKGSDVTSLQNFLKSQGTDIYPEGLVTGYYGNLTKAAVGKFQIKQGIVKSASDPGYGNVGPKTRAKINSLLGL